MAGSALGPYNIEGVVMKSSHSGCDKVPRIPRTEYIQHSGLGSLRGIDRGYQYVGINVIGPSTFYDVLRRT